MNSWSRYAFASSPPNPHPNLLGNTPPLGRFRGVADPQKQPLALHGPLPGQADLALGLVEILQVAALVLQDQQPAIGEAGEEVGIEPVTLVGGARQAEAVGMAVEVAQPQLHFGQGVEDDGHLRFRLVHLPHGGIEVLGKEPAPVGRGRGIGGLGGEGDQDLLRGDGEGRGGIIQ